jgi:hypothetical protein
MNGQWIGRYTGSNTGLLVVEIDDMGTHYEGRAFAYDDNTLLPGTVVLIKTSDKAKHYQQNLELFPINPRTGDPGTWDQIAQHFPAGTAFPRRADVTLHRTGKNLKVSWTTDIGTSGAVHPSRGQHARMAANGVWTPRSRPYKAEARSPLPASTLKSPRSPFIPFFSTAF